MAEWVEKGSIKGPPGEIPDVSDFLRDSDVSQSISEAIGEKVASDKAVKDYVDSNVVTYENATAGQSGLMSAADKTKLDGIADGANNYTHPTSDAGALGSNIYKITTDANGHIIAATPISKNDITALGIPSEDTNTTYTAGSGLTLSGTEFGIADGGVIGKHLDDNCVMERNIAIGSVTSDKIPALAITTPKLVDNAVTAMKMADDAVATRSIQDGAVTAEKIAKGVIPEIPDVSLTSLGVTATAEELNYMDGITSNVQTQLDGKANVAHAHDADDISSGTLSIDRIPSIPDSKITGMSADKLTGTIPSKNLPSYVDDVIEADNYNALPLTGEAGKIYVDKETNKTYRWGGSAYVEISASLALGETSSTAFRGDHGKTAYDHAQNKGSQFASGLYKIATNSEGHVTGATAVTKEDITSLGIPGEDKNTTYEVATSNTDGLMSSEDKVKLDGIDSDISSAVASEASLRESADEALQTSIAGKANVEHNHEVVDVTGLQDALDSKASLAHTHSTSDVTGLDDVLSEKSDNGHKHTSKDVTDLNDKLDMKANVTHSHAIDDVTDLKTTLNGKAASVHTHDMDDVDGLQDALDGKANVDDASLAALGITVSAAEINYVDGATSNIQSQLDGKAGFVHTHSQGDINGLGTALDGKANISHTHNTEDVTGLSNTLATKADKVHSHAVKDVTGLQGALDEKLDADSFSLGGLGITATAQEINYVDGVTSNVQSQLDGKAAATHTHTQDDVDGLATALSGKANATHTHTIANVTGLQNALDDKMDVGSVSLGSLGVTATAAELNYMDGVTSNVQTQLNGKANSSHTHSIENVSGLQTALNGKAASSHTHSAANVTSGTFDIARIPSIPDSKITGISASKIIGTIPSDNLPSYVDDVLEYDSKSTFPESGEAGKIYIDKTTNKTYRWSGSSYVEISASLALGTTSSTAFRGDYGNVAYQHAQAKGSAFANGLYKITTNAHGHVTGATAVAKSDITALGIPGTNTTYSNATTSASGLMSATDKSKLDGIASGANKYTHPTSEAGAKTSGLYKIATDANGHVTAATVVTKTDITDLGIPAQDTNTTYSNMKGASTSAAGKAGLVPAPSTGEANRYLRSDGTWSVPPDTNTTYTLSSFGITATAAELNKLDGVTATAAELNYVDGVTSNIQTQLNGKAASSHTHQYAGSASAGGSANSAVKLDTSAGSATQPVYFSGGKPVATTYSLGASVPSGAKFTDTTYSTMKGATSSAAGSTGLVPAPAAGKQTSFLRGDGTWVVPTNTTYTNMSGASSSAAGKAGLVPAPSAGASNRYLRSDGTWAVPPDTNTTYTLSSFGITATAAELNKLDGVTATAAELNYVDGVTSNIQTQLNGKAASSHTHAASQITGLTASRALVSDANGHPTVSAVTSTELGYLDGVTSAIQTQLNGKAASSHTHSVATTSANGFMSSADKVKLNGIEAGATQNNDVIIETKSPLNNNMSVTGNRSINTISIEPASYDGYVLTTEGDSVSWLNLIDAIAYSAGYGEDGQVLTYDSMQLSWAESGAKVHRIYSDSDTWMNFEITQEGDDDGLSGKTIPLSDFGSVAPQKGDLVIANRDDILRYVYSVSGSGVDVITIIPKELPSVLPISKGGTGVASEDALVQKVFNSASTPKASATQYGVVKFASDEDFKAYMGIS